MSIFITNIWSFLVVSLSSFGIRVMIASQNEFRSGPSFSIFWKSLRGIGVNSLNVQQNSPLKPTGLGLYGRLRFLIIDSISLLLIGLFRFSISS